MRIRSAFLLLAGLLAAAPGCTVFYGIGKTLGLISPPSIDVDGPVPPDFRLSVSVRDMADPATDYTLVFDRSGKCSYEVAVRSPRRREIAGPFEITEDQVIGLWKAVGEAKFDELNARYPKSGDGKDKAQGMQTYYVFAQGADHRVESHFQANADLEKVRTAAVAAVPREIMTASGALGSPKDRPSEFLADTTTHLFHMPDCPQLKDVPAQRRQPFGTSYDALNYGYQPCPECQPLRTR